MNYADNKAWHQLRHWIEQQGFTVFGTLKFFDGTATNEARGEQTVRNCLNALDRAYYGKAVENVGMRHKRLVFKHLGTSGANLHYHFLAKPNSNPKLYAELARLQWAKMNKWTISAEETQIDAVRSNKAASAYVLHEYGKLGADSICLSASSLNPPPRNPLSYRNLAQLRRLLRLHDLGAVDFDWSADECNALGQT
ncbi:hypothetical protein [Ruegeria atlantica]|uniref:hypothetical protein n=1 Tax=Ruegeria atlantica TaxID=81569 RepID=UPI00147FAA00|nr:hypothetical protein [Ruegeria atlantica]